jgi:hypothetical protein
MSSVIKKQIIRENSRFGTYRGEYDGEDVFIKTAVAKDLREAVWQEVAGMLTLSEMDPRQSAYLIPSIKCLCNDTIVTSWINGKVMFDDFVDKNRDAVLDHMTLLIGLFIYIDGKTSSSIGVTRYNPHSDKKTSIDKSLKNLKTPDYLVS